MELTLKRVAEMAAFAAQSGSELARDVVKAVANWDPENSLEAAAMVAIRDAREWRYHDREFCDTLAVFALEVMGPEWVKGLDPICHWVRAGCKRRSPFYLWSSRS